MASSSSSNPAINLLECSSEELAKYLLEHRFENDGMATTAFLLEGTTALPNADAIADQIMGNGNENDNENRKKKDQQVNIVSSRSEEEPPSALLGESLHSKPFELSLTNPRGKFNVTFHHDGIQAVTVKNPQTLSIPAGAVRDMIVFPKPQDCQKVVKASNASATSPMVLICFQENDDNKEGEDAAEGVTFKGKPLSQICFSLPTTLEGLQDAISQLEECEDATNVESTWIQLLQHSLNIQDNKVYRIVNPAQKNVHTKNGQWSFQSHQEANTSTTSGGMPFVKCYYGVQDGALYPMQQGLLFFKPPLFVPRAKLHSIACGRGNTASSRYVDMVITTNTDESLEFTNIHREELAVLNDYIYKVLIPAMQRDQVAAEDNGSDNGNDDDDDDENSSTEEAVAVAAAAVDDDDDGVVEAEADVVEEGPRGRTKRRAAREATQQTKQHFQQRAGAGDDEEDDGDDESDEENFSDGDSENEEDEGEEEMEEEDDEEEVAQATESDGDATDEEEEEEEEDVEMSPPKSKKRKSS